MSIYQRYRDFASHHDTRSKMRAAVFDDAAALITVKRARHDTHKGDDLFSVDADENIDANVEI